MKVYVHIGIHKTASSFLQQSIFPYAKSCTYVAINDLEDFKNYILYEDDFEFNKEKALKLLKKNLPGSQPNLRIIISHEEFYGNPFLAVIDRKRNIDRLIEVFKKDIFFIIFIRDQINLLHSLYSQYIKTGGTAPFHRFLKYKKYPLIFNENYFLYDKYLKYIRNSVGNDSLLIILFEDFLLNKVRVLSQIKHYIGYKSLVQKSCNEKIINPSLHRLGIPILRQINKFTKSPKEPFLLLNTIFHIAFKTILLHFPFKKLSSEKSNISLDNYFDLDKIKASNNQLIKEFPEINISKHRYLL